MWEFDPVRPRKPHSEKRDLAKVFAFIQLIIDLMTWITREGDGQHSLLLLHRVISESQSVSIEFSSNGSGLGEIGRMRKSNSGTNPTDFLSPPFLDTSKKPHSDKRISQDLGMVSSMEGCGQPLQECDSHKYP